LKTKSMSDKSAIRVIRILERVWAIIGLTCLSIGAYETHRLGFQESYIFFIFALVSGIVFWLRRRRRTRIEEESKNGE